MKIYFSNETEKKLFEKCLSASLSSRTFVPDVLMEKAGKGHIRLFLSEPDQIAELLLEAEGADGQLPVLLPAKHFLSILKLAEKEKEVEVEIGENSLLFRLGKKKIKIGKGESEPLSPPEKEDVVVLELDEGEESRMLKEALAAAGNFALKIKGKQSPSELASFIFLIPVEEGILVAATDAVALLWKEVKTEQLKLESSICVPSEIGQLAEEAEKIEICENKTTLVRNVFRNVLPHISKSQKVAPESIVNLIETYRKENKNLIELEGRELKQALDEIAKLKIKAAGVVAVKVNEGEIEVYAGEENITYRAAIPAETSASSFRFGVKADYLRRFFEIVSEASEGKIKIRLAEPEGKEAVVDKPVIFETEEACMIVAPVRIVE